MIIGDARLKVKRGRKKVSDAIKMHGGITLMSSGITADDMRLTKASADAGVKVFEVHHSGIALNRGYRGRLTSLEGLDVRHEITVEDMAKVVRTMREIVSADTYITVSFTGTYTELNPVPFTLEDALALSQAGADGLLCFKVDLEDIKDLINIGHQAGLCTDITLYSPGKYADMLGVKPLETKDIGNYAKRLEKLGVDSIFIELGQAYLGFSAKKIPDFILERIKAVTSSVDVPVIAGGGITPDNFRDLKGTGVKMIAVGTSFDDIAKRAISEAVKTFLSLGKD